MTSHPNKAEFIGILTVCDKPSDRSPSGARGHIVQLTRACVEDALSSLAGMALNCTAEWTGHATRGKIGVIDTAELNTNGEVIVTGHLWKIDFPDILVRIMASSEELGMSYELHDAHVKDMRERVWLVTKCTFIGAAIVGKKHAAYECTEFCII